MKKARENRFVQTQKKRTVVHTRLKIGGLLLMIAIGITMIAINYNTFDGVMHAATMHSVIRALDTSNMLGSSYAEYVGDLPLKALMNFVDYRTAISILLLCMLVAIAAILWRTTKYSVLLGVAAVSPFFLRGVSEYSATTVAVVIGIGALYYMHKPHAPYGLLPHSIATLLNPFIGIALAVVSGIKAYRKNLPLWLAGLYSFVALIGFKMPQRVIEENNLSVLFVEFGSVYGISLVVLIIGLLGLITAWKNETEALGVVIVGLITTILHPMHGLIIVGLASIYFAAVFTQKIIDEVWESSELQFLSICLIICSILMSGVAYATSYEPIPKNEMDCYVWIAMNTDDDVRIVTDPDKGIEIVLYGQRESLFWNPKYSNENVRKKEDLITLLKTREVQITHSLATAYRIDYFFITEPMRDGKIWSQRDGLLFVLDTSEIAIKRYANEYCEIWQYKPITKANTTDIDKVDVDRIDVDELYVKDNMLDSTG